METGQQWSSPGNWQPPAGGAQPPGTPAWGGPLPAGPPPSSGQSWVQRNPRGILVIGIVVVLLIVAAIIGKAIASHDSIAVGDCVQTSPSVTTGWDIKKVDCSQQYNLGSSTYKVDSVLDGSSASCYGSDETTFNDDPAGKTYCLSPWLGPNE